MKLSHIEHLGIAVKSLEEAIPYYEQVLGLKCYSIEEVQTRRLELHSLRLVRPSWSFLRAQILRAQSLNSSRRRVRVSTTLLLPLRMAFRMLLQSWRAKV